jgi:hypothetical protein
MRWVERRVTNSAKEATCGNYAKLEIVDIVNDRKQDVSGLGKWYVSYRASSQCFFLTKKFTHRFKKCL